MHTDVVANTYQGIFYPVVNTWIHSQTIASLTANEPNACPLVFFYTNTWCSMHFHLMHIDWLDIVCYLGKTQEISMLTIYLRNR